MRSYWYETQGSWIRALLVGAAAGAVVVGLAWWGTWRFSSPDPAPRQEAAQLRQAVDLPVSGRAEASEATSVLALCQTVHDEQDAPLRAATEPLGQWEVHIGAMNKLVSGAITLDQASQFWNQTRVGAHAKLHDFETARHQYDQRIFRCPTPGPAAAPESELETCHRAVATRARTLRLATVALATWEQHVHHMEMLRNGEMTPEQATQLWLQTWQAGDRELRAYRAAARTATGPTC